MIVRFKGELKKKKRNKTIRKFYKTPIKFKKKKKLQKKIPIKCVIITGEKKKKLEKSDCATNKSYKKIFTLKIFTQFSSFRHEEIRVIFRASYESRRTNTNEKTSNFHTEGRHPQCSFRIL